MKAVTLTIALAGALSVAQASSLRSEIEASNKDVAKAMVTKNFKSLEKMLKSAVTPNFVYVEDGRTQTFAQMMMGMKMGLSSMTKVTNADAKTLTLKEKGNAATATSRHTMAGIVMGPDKKAHKMVFIGSSTDSYVKIGGQWKMSKMVMKTDTMTMDGKKMDPSSMDMGSGK